MLANNKIPNFSACETTAVYINHNINEKSADWGKHCDSVCKSLNIPFKQINININSLNGESLEAVAREKRYAKLMSLIEQDDVLLTAHHQDDQAETFLLQALRGAGVKGLASMPYKKRFGKGWHARPLLSYTRKELEAYAQEHSLSWVEDDSNQDSCFDRNFLRNEIVPKISARWPSFHRSLSQSAAYCAEADELSEDLAKIDYAVCSGEQQTLAIQMLQQLSIIRQKNVLRYWLRQCDCTVPSGQFIERILNELLTAKEDAQPLVEWAGGQVRRFQTRLYALCELSEFTNNVLEWDLQNDLVVGDKILTASHTKGMGIASSKISQDVTVKFRQVGEKIKLPNQKVTKDLKKLLQEWGVPPWLRQSIPLIYHAGDLISVVGYCYSADYAAKDDEPGISIEGLGNT
jgi:tRNA(Ile)-lysidine synthase